MDDSERSYGYSKDIYHGRRGTSGQYGQPTRAYGYGPFYPDQPHWERSYEYGPETGMGEVSPDELAPEEQAIHVQDQDRRERWFSSPRRHGVARDASRDSESFTWEIPGPQSGKGPRGYRRADERIHEEVCERLRAHGWIDASEVEVQVREGEVTLTGTVADRRQKRLAADLAEGVRGIIDVHNRLRLG
jgi:BON domain-containing protein